MVLLITVEKIVESNVDTADAPGGSVKCWAASVRSPQTLVSGSTRADLEDAEKGATGSALNLTPGFSRTTASHSAAAKTVRIEPWSLRDLTKKTSP